MGAAFISFIYQKIDVCLVSWIWNYRDRKWLWVETVGTLILSKASPKSTLNQGEWE